MFFIDFTRVQSVNEFVSVFLLVASFVYEIDILVKSYTEIEVCKIGNGVATLLARVCESPKCHKMTNFAN